LLFLAALSTPNSSFRNISWGRSSSHCVNPFLHLAMIRTPDQLTRPERVAVHEWLLQFVLAHGIHKRSFEVAARRLHQRGIASNDGNSCPERSILSAQRGAHAGPATFAQKRIV
jgi:hypothetical protein